VVTEPLRRFSKSVWGFALGFTIAALMTVAATVLAVTGSGPTGGRLSLIWWLLIGSLLVCLGLAALIVHRVLRVRGAVGAVQSGARLHLRFVGLFSAAAVVPAIAVAAFMGAALSLGLEQWFDARITRLFEAGAGVGARAVSNQEAAIEGELSLMIVDLNRAAAGLESDTERYLSFLGRQAEMRAFPAAYVISSDGTVLASVAADGAPDFAAPSGTMFTDAEADPQRMATFFNEGEGVLRALARLEAYPDAYLYVAQRIDRELFTRLRDFDTAITAYRAAAQRRGELQTIFAFAYLTTALLVLLGAVRLGLANASRIAEPIGRLAHAADRVAAGDLAARVHVGSERDEIDGLSQAFNGMTAQLQQRAMMRKPERDLPKRFWAGSVQASSVLTGTGGWLSPMTPRASFYRNTKDQPPCCLVGGLWMWHQNLATSSMGQRRLVPRRRAASI
jgi:two-component system nitrogen regulation sensor histidine kinase NtrY